MEPFVDEAVARQVDRSYRQGYKELEVHENGGTCCLVCPHKPLFRDLSQLYLHANGDLPSSPHGNANRAPEYPRPVSQHVGLVRYLYRLLRNSELKLPPPRFPAAMSRSSSKAELKDGVKEAKETEAPLNSPFSSRPVSAAAGHVSSSRAALAASSPQHAVADTLAQVAETLGSATSRDTGTMLNPPVVILCNIKQETFGAVVKPMAIKPMSPAASASPLGRTYSDMGLDPDASRADLKELLQAMEPSARRCVTQAVRLANSGYVLLEFQRVTAHNLTGYVEANKLAQQFKRTASGRVEWEQYRRSGSLEPQPRAFAYFALAADMERLDPRKENVEWEQASTSDFAHDKPPGPPAPLNAPEAMGAMHAMGMGMGAMDAMGMGMGNMGDSWRAATYHAEAAAGGTRATADSVGVGLSDMCSTRAASGSFLPFACCPALDFTGQVSGLVGGLELPELLGKSGADAWPVPELDLDSSRTLKNFNEAAETLKGMGESVGSELFGLGKQLNQVSSLGDEPWESMIAGLLINGNAQDVISSSLSAPAANLSPPTPATVV